jgi:hypothetical protein
MKSKFTNGYSYGFPVLIQLSARAAISLLGIILMLLGLIPTTEDSVLRPYFGVIPVVNGLSGALLGVWQRFDAIHYLRIASTGYSSTDLSVFFPLYPILVRLSGIVLAHNYLLSSILVSSTAALLASIVFYRLVLDETGDLGTAKRATAYMIFFPPAFILLAPYTESLTLLLMVSAFICGRKSKWLAAAALGFAAALTRPVGMLIAVPFLAEAITPIRERKLPSIKQALAIAAPLLGFASFVVYRGIAGFPPLSEVQFDYWGRMTAIPFSIIPVTLQRMVSGQAMLIEYLDLSIVLLMVVLGVYVARRLPLPYSAYYWAVMITNLSLTRLGQPISSQARFATILFPAFIVLGQFGSSAILHRVILILSISLWLFLGGQFLMWGWVG